MTSIDERVVSMSFENARFEAGVARSMSTLTKLSASISKIGSTTGFTDIEKAANKVTLTGPATALDKLKAKLGFPGAPDAFGEIDKAANKVGLEGPSSALDKLKQKLGFPEADAAFAAVEKSSAKVTLSEMGNSIDKVGLKISALQTAAVAAFGTIVSEATRAAGSVIKDFTFGPIASGLEEYSTNLNSIQTILANTEVSGADLDDVNGALLKLNKYSDQTIYNFSQMAKNIGTFTAAGVDLDTSVASIKGIANLAALSGSNADQAATAMYQLSQAIASGKVGLQDWNSVVNAGMGGTTFQRALANTAVAMGEISDKAVDLEGPMKNVKIQGQSFRDSIMAAPGKQSWLTSEVLTNTLQQFTGDLSKAELKAQGFNDAQIKAIQATAQTAKNAATEVKTIGGVFDVVKESIGSGWSQTFQLIFGDFEQAKETFTELTTFITDFIGANADARNKVLKDWGQLGGRTVLIEGIKDAFDALMSVLKPIKDAFRDIFPRKTGQDLYDLTLRFHQFMHQLEIGPDTIDNIRSTFKGFFAILDIGKQFVVGIFQGLGRLFELISGEGSGGFLDLTGNIGDFVASIDEGLKKGAYFERFFEGLAEVLSVPIKFLQKIAHGIATLFGGADPDAGDEMADSLGNVTDKLDPFAKILGVAEDAWKAFVGVLGEFWERLKPIFGEVGTAIGDFFDKLSDAFENADYGKIADVLQVGLLGAIVLALKKGFGKVDVAINLFDGLSDVLGGLTGTLRQMQSSLKAATLFAIAGAVGVLAGAVLVLSQIDPKKLATAMAGVTAALGELFATAALLTKLGGGLGKTGFLALPLIAGAMIELAFAVDLLAVAVYAMSKLSWEDLAKGLLGVGFALEAIAMGVTKMGGGARMLAIGAAMLPIAAALVIMAGAMKIFGTMSWNEIAKGLVGVGFGLAAIGIGVKTIGKSIIVIGPGLVFAAAGMVLLAGSMRMLGAMSWDDLAKGILGVAFGLGAIGLAFTRYPMGKGLIAQAAGLLVLAIALNGIALAVRSFGGMSIIDLAKGLAAMGASIVILAEGLKFMGKGALAGAGALLAAAIAIGLLVPSLVILGSMSLISLGKGLLAITLAIGIMAGAGAIAAGPLELFGLALVSVGAGLFLIAASVYIVAKGLVLLGGKGAASVGVMVAAMTAFVLAIPKMVIEFVKGLVEIAAEVAKVAPQLVKSFIQITLDILDGIVDAAPKLGEAFLKLLAAGLKVLVEGIPMLVVAGGKLVFGILKGILEHIGEITITVGKIIAKFLGALAKNLPKIMENGAKVLMAFLKGIADNVADVTKMVFTIVTRFLQAAAQKLPSLVDAGAKALIAFLKGVAKNMKDVVRAGFDIIIAFVEGIFDNLDRLVKAGVKAIGQFIEGVASSAVELARSAARALLTFLAGIRQAVKDYGPQIVSAGAGIGVELGRAALLGLKDAITPGVSLILADTIDGILEQIRKATQMMEFLIGDILDKVAQARDRALHPGKYDSSSAADIWGNQSEGAKAFLKMLKALSEGLDDVLNMEPTITPVLDLTQVEIGAEEIKRLLMVAPISAAPSYRGASHIAGRQAVAAEEAATTDATGPVLHFEQTNVSPKALSEGDIYRHTNNQLSLAKRALAKK